MIPPRRLLMLLVAASAPAAAQQSLGIFGLWGAFRAPDRCYAIGEPDQQGRPEYAGAYASVAYWPQRGVRGQAYFRLRQPKRAGSAVLLRIDDRTFQLRGGGAEAWGADAAADAEIVAAMRTGIEMSLETRSAGGALLRDVYALRGAATAIDAAAIACARRP
jgi:hypothetical protein